MEDNNKICGGLNVGLCNRNKMKTEFKEEVQQNVVNIMGQHSPPPGAVLLSPDQVFELNLKTINSWSSTREMFSLKYGTQLLGGMASLSGIMFISHLRSKMLLRNYARLASYAPTVFFPGVAASMFQQMFVTNKIIRGEMVCPLCTEVRMISIQLLAGVLQPFVLSILASSALAKTAMTYPLPPLNEFWTLFRVYAKLLKPIQSSIILLLAANIFSAFAVAYNQGKAIEKVHTRILSQHNYLFK